MIESWHSLLTFTDNHLKYSSYQLYVSTIPSLKVCWDFQLRTLVAFSKLKLCLGISFFWTFNILYSHFLLRIFSIFFIISMTEKLYPVLKLNASPLILFIFSISVT